MGISTTSRDADAAHEPRLRRWLRAPAGAGQTTAPAALVEELEREVALLREENARLRVARERMAARPVNERVRDTLPLLRAEASADDADEPWAVLTECMLLRDSLADACRELERGARELRRRLEAILPAAEGARPEALVGDDLQDAA